MLTVKERGQFVATTRFIHVFLMETLAAWVPTTPEMEVKLLFGEHIWDMAQHADALGKRTFELRMPLQHSLRPIETFVQLLTEVSATSLTSHRLAAIYDVLLPMLTERYRQYIEITDALSDAPTVRILERHIGDAARMMDAGHALREALPALKSADRRWTEALVKRAAEIDALVVPIAQTTAGA